MNEMDERTREAFTFAQDTTKQLITLSTAIIALTITFTGELLDEQTLSGVRKLLYSAWLCYLFSLICGVWTLLALTGTLAPVGRATPLSIRGRNVTLPSALQIISFCIGTILLVAFGIRAL